METKGYKLDNSVRIDHLSFGELQNFAEINARFPDAGVMHPLDGFEKQKSADHEAMRLGFFIKAVPAIFLSELGNWAIRLLGDKAMAKNEVF